jgi:hypothetical protein
MKTHVLPDCLRTLLMRSVGHRHYSLVVTAIAFVTRRSPSASPSSPY